MAKYDRLWEINENEVNNKLPVDLDEAQPIIESMGVENYLKALLVEINDLTTEEENSIYEVASKYSLENNLKNYFETLDRKVNVDFNGDIQNEMELIEFIPEEFEEEFQEIGYDAFLAKYFDDVNLEYKFGDVENTINYKIFKDTNNTATILKNTEKIINDFVKEYEIEDKFETNLKELINLEKEKVEQYLEENYDKKIITAYKKIDSLVNSEREIDRNLISNFLESTEGVASFEDVDLTDALNISKDTLYTFISEEKYEGLFNCTNDYITLYDNPRASYEFVNNVINKDPNQSIKQISNEIVTDYAEDEEDKEIYEELFKNKYLKMFENISEETKESELSEEQIEHLKKNDLSEDDKKLILSLEKLDIDSNEKEISDLGITNYNDLSEKTKNILNFDTKQLTDSQKEIIKIAEKIEDFANIELSNIDETDFKKLYLLAENLINTPIAKAWQNKEDEMKSVYKLPWKEISVDEELHSILEQVMNQLDSEYINENKDLIETLIYDTERHYQKTDYTVDDVLENLENTISTDGKFIKAPEHDYMFDFFIDKLEETMKAEKINEIIIDNATSTDQQEKLLELAQSDFIDIDRKKIEGIEEENLYKVLLLSEVTGQFTEDKELNNNMYKSLLDNYKTSNLNIDIEKHIIENYVLNTPGKQQFVENGKVNIYEFKNHLQTEDESTDSLVRKELNDFYDFKDEKVNRENRIIDLAQEIMEEYGQSAVEDIITNEGWENYPEFQKVADELTKALTKSEVKDFEIAEKNYIEMTVSEKAHQVIVDYLEERNIETMIQYKYSNIELKNKFTEELYDNHGIDAVEIAVEDMGRDNYPDLVNTNSDSEEELLNSKYGLKILDDFISKYNFKNMSQYLGEEETDKSHIINKLTEEYNIDNIELVLDHEGWEKYPKLHEERRIAVNTDEWESYLEVFNTDEGKQVLKDFVQKYEIKTLDEFEKFDFNSNKKENKMEKTEQERYALLGKKEQELLSKTRVTKDIEEGSGIGSGGRQLLKLAEKKNGEELKSEEVAFIDVKNSSVAYVMAKEKGLKMSKDLDKELKGYYERSKKEMGLKLPKKEKDNNLSL